MSNKQLLQLLLFALINMAAAGTTAPSLSASPIVFARNFFRAINEQVPQINLVVSPAAARSSLTLAFMGAGGKTADQLRAGLLLGAAKKKDVAKQHAEFWSKECTCSDRGVALRLVTRLYVPKEQELQPDFNLNAAEFFNAQADAINFSDVDGAMRSINKWLERQTFHTVRNLLTPADFNKETGVILVNSIYFRAKWSQRFAVERTMPNDFWINLQQRMQVGMMRQVGEFRYSESAMLNARLLELPFEESDISMLFILPQDRDGLTALEQKLQEYDLNEVTAKLAVRNVDVQLPKFKIECDLDMRRPLAKLGITHIFEPAANLSGLFIQKTPQSITEARQKLNLDVNESGCEVDADSPAPAAALAEPKADSKLFKADHPFVFAIRNNKTVYFVGHFVKP